MDAKSKTNPQLSNVNEAVTDLLDETKKYASVLCEEGVKKIKEVEKEASHYSDELLEKVRENPLKAILIAGGVGLLLSAILRK